MVDRSQPLPPVEANAQPSRQRTAASALTRTAAALLGALGLLAFPACQSNDGFDEAYEEIGDETSDAGEEIEDAGEALEDDAEEFEDEVEDEIDDYT